jgi:hypothetical protein
MNKLQSWIVLALTLSMVHCGLLKPRKPAGMPSEAIWVGSRSDGAFVQIQTKELEGWKIRVYDRHGKTLAEGLYILRSAARSELQPDDLASYSNGVLHLKDGSLMTPKTKP